MVDDRNIFEVGRSLNEDGQVIVHLRIKDKTNGNEVTMDICQATCNKLINLLARASVTTVNDLGDMYAAFECKYNPYPVQMSREEAFRHALHDELIDEETYYLARKYYGNLWNYVGD